MRTDSFFNEINDRDEQWGPLLFLRPERHREMTFVHLSSLAILLGGLFGSMGDIVLALTARAVHRPIPPAYVMPAVLTLIYYVVSRYTLAAAWNRRARRLARLR